MRVVIQRVRSANVVIQKKVYASIDVGMVILLGIAHTDTRKDIQWLCRKLSRLRIFPDKDGKMNLSIQDAGGSFLTISQFTLHADTKKGNRPSFIRAAKPDVAIPLYEAFVDALKKESGRPVKTGIFGADMQVTLTNDGPVTIIMDTNSA